MRRALLTATAAPLVEHTQTFTYTGSAQSWTVPSGVTSVTVECWAGSGLRCENGTAGSGRNGDYIKGTLPTTPAESLALLVGQASAYSAFAYPEGGMGSGSAPNRAGGGGGRSDASGASGSVIAGGGGGGGTQSDANKGGGQPWNASHSTGTKWGSSGASGQYSGGGGSGLLGGVGGPGASLGGYSGQSGVSGSATAITTTLANNVGNGKITLTWMAP